MGILAVLTFFFYSSFLNRSLFILVRLDPFLFQYTGDGMRYYFFFYFHSSSFSVIGHGTGYVHEVFSGIHDVTFVAYFCWSFMTVRAYIRRVCG